MTLKEAAKILALKPQGISTEVEEQARRNLKKVLIVKTSWYAEVIDPLEQSALDFLSGMGIGSDKIERKKIPGSFELPLALKLSYPFDFAIALGCVIQGDTPHFEYVCQAVTQGLMQVQLECRTPIGFGVLTVNNLEQALARKDKGAEAAQAAYVMYLHAVNNTKNLK